MFFEKENQSRKQGLTEINVELDMAEHLACSVGGKRFV